MAAPAVVGTPTTAFATTGAGLSIPRPSGLQAGDVVVLAYRAQDAAVSAVNVPAGFSRAGVAFDASSSTSRVHGFWIKTITDPSSEPASYAISLTGPSTTRHVGIAFVLRGGTAAATAVVGNATPYNAGGTPPNKTAPAYTASAAPSLVLAQFGSEITSGNSHYPTSTPAGYTKIAEVATGADGINSRTYLWVGYLSTTTSTSIAAATTTWGATSSAHAESIALTQQGTAAPSRDARGAVAISGRARAITPWRAGFASVARLLRTYGATSAHRGGSTAWPEMSRLAYERAAMAGYGWLEFSAQVSADSWWFGMHDAEFDRVALVSGSPAPSTLTRAQIEATYQNRLNAKGMPQPWYGLIDFLDDWTPTHVVMVDPKYGIARVAEFLDILDAHGGPSKIIVKFFGVGSGAGALADAAAARGYQTWGYFYEADFLDGDLAAWQGRWSILGMNYNASAEAWAAVTSYGKPVVGHIIPNQAGYAAAMSRGAWLAQVSGVPVVAAVGAGVFAHGLLELDGAAPAIQRHARTAEGTISLGGDASATAGGRGEFEATLKLVGSASAIPRATTAGHAELTIDGSALAAARLSATAAGEVNITGSAAALPRSAGSAAGRLSIVGSATAVARYERSAFGTVTLDGRAEAAQPASHAATGRVELRGSAIATARYARSALGMVALEGCGIAPRPINVPRDRRLTGWAPDRTLTGSAPDRTLEGGIA